MSTVQAVCVGVITIDTVALVDKYPSEDERVVALEITRGGGGPAAVAAVAGPVLKALDPKAVEFGRGSK